VLFSAPVRKILALREPVDMRKSFDGLIAIVKGVLAEDPLSGSLFVFQSPAQLPQARLLGSHGILSVRQAPGEGAIPSSGCRRQV